MKTFSWDSAKNTILKTERGISFEDIIYYIEHGNLLAIIRHPNQERYPEQKMYIVEIDKYAYLIPFIETNNEIFLKTIIPSRKATKKHLGL